MMQVVPGELTIITGVPNSGKSEWIDALMVNLADQFGWRFGLCSMEKKVGCNLLHAWQLISMRSLGRLAQVTVSFSLCNFTHMNERSCDAADEGADRKLLAHYSNCRWFFSSAQSVIIGCMSS